MQHQQTVTKADFARMRNVSRVRVTQWIAEGKIGPEALHGEGPRARIIVPVALEQLRQRLDLSQRFGLNGLGTRLDGEAPATPPAVQDEQTLPLAPEEKVDPVEARIKREKLRQAEIQTERMEEERRERRGLYMRTADARAGMEHVAGAMLKVFEGGLTDLANAIAAQFGVPQRDVIHLLRSEFRAVRAKAARAAAASRDAVPQIVEDELDDEPADELESSSPAEPKGPPH